MYNQVNFKSNKPVIKVGTVSEFIDLLLSGQLINMTAIGDNGLSLVLNTPQENSNFTFSNLIYFGLTDGTVTDMYKQIESLPDNKWIITLDEYKDLAIANFNNNSSGITYWNFIQPNSFNLEYPFYTTVSVSSVKTSIVRVNSKEEHIRVYNEYVAYTQHVNKYNDVVGFLSLLAEYPVLSYVDTPLYFKLEIEHAILVLRKTNYTNISNFIVYELNEIIDYDDFIDNCYFVINKETNKYTGSDSFDLFHETLEDLIVQVRANATVEDTTSEVTPDVNVVAPVEVVAGKTKPE